MRKISAKVSSNNTNLEAYNNTKIKFLLFLLFSKNIGVQKTKHSKSEIQPMCVIRSSIPMVSKSNSVNSVPPEKHEYIFPDSIF